MSAGSAANQRRGVLLIEPGEMGMAPCECGLREKPESRETIQPES